MNSIQVVVSGHSMWPVLDDGQVIECEEYVGQELFIGEIVVFLHPFNSNLTIIKRIQKINPKGDLWVVGDNPDPTSSEDSHNFGFVSKNNVLGINRG
tara:strand:+ start:4582 stop:4872 length:291 start_codon:yes stop_codon:yes gene_type:complete